MPTTEERLKALEDQLKRVRNQISGSIVVGGALQQTPGDATLTLPHNDSWIFEENVDDTHAANLRYVIASNTRQVVSARLSIKMAPYRTYNNFSATTTGAGTAHNHASANHAHAIPIDAGPFTNAVGQNAAGGNLSDAFGPTTAPVNATTPANTGNEAAHTHPITVTSFLGVTEGATATGVTIKF